MNEKDFLKAVMASRGEDPKGWRKKLEKALGYPPSHWDNKRHGRDQLVGIMRKLEDGKDPFEAERRDSFNELMNDVSTSIRINRDDRDGQLGRDVDSGAWQHAPGDARRAPLKAPPSLFEEEL